MKCPCWKRNVSRINQEDILDKQYFESMTVHLEQGRATSNTEGGTLALSWSA